MRLRGSRTLWSKANRISRREQTIIAPKMGLCMLWLLMLVIKLQLFIKASFSLLPSNSPWSKESSLMSSISVVRWSTRTAGRWRPPPPSRPSWTGPRRGTRSWSGSRWTSRSEECWWLEQTRIPTWPSTFTGRYRKVEYENNTKASPVPTPSLSSPNKLKDPTESASEFLSLFAVRSKETQLKK